MRPSLLLRQPPFGFPTPPPPHPPPYPPLPVHRLQFLAFYPLELLLYSSVCKLDRAHTHTLIYTLHSQLSRRPPDITPSSSCSSSSSFSSSSSPRSTIVGFDRRPRRRPGRRLAYPRSDRLESLSLPVYGPRSTAKDQRRRCSSTLHSLVTETSLMCGRVTRYLVGLDRTCLEEKQPAS